MYAQSEKPKENKNRIAANSVTQRKSNGAQGFDFANNRQESITHANSLVSIHRDYHSFSADDKKPKQFMTARLAKKENRAPTVEEIQATTAAATANSQRLAGHGRAPHDKKGRARPAYQQEANTAKDIQNAVDQAIQLKGKGGVTMDDNAASTEQDISLSMEQNGNKKRMAMSCKHVIESFTGTWKNFNSGPSTNVIINASLTDCMAIFEVFCDAVATNWDKDKCPWPPVTSIDTKGVTLGNPNGGGHVFPTGGASTFSIGPGDEWKCFTIIAKGDYTPHLKPKIIEFYKKYEDILKTTSFKTKMDTEKSKYITTQGK